MDLTGITVVRQITNFESIDLSRTANTFVRNDDGSYTMYCELLNDDEDAVDVTRPDYYHYSNIQAVIYKREYPPATVTPIPGQNPQTPTSTTGNNTPVVNPAIPEISNPPVSTTPTTSETVPVVPSNPEPENIFKKNYESNNTPPVVNSTEPVVNTNTTTPTTTETTIPAGGTDASSSTPGTTSNGVDGSTSPAPEPTTDEVSESSFTYEITKLFEEAGYDNTLMVLNKETGEIDVVFASSDNTATGDKKRINYGTTSFDGLDFLLLPNGWNKQAVQNAVSDYLDGLGEFVLENNKLYFNSETNGKTKVSAEVFHSNGISTDNFKHARVSEDSNIYTIGFEDLTCGGDKDYDDLVFSVQTV